MAPRLMKQRTLKIISFLVLLGLISFVGYLFAQNMLYQDENMLANKYYKEGVLHFNMRHYVAAIEHFQKALTEKPDYIKARTWLAKSYHYAGYIDNAFTEWKRIEELYEMDPIYQLKLENIMFERSIGSEYEPAGSFIFQKSFDIKSPSTSSATSFPRAIYSDNQNNIYVVDYNLNRVMVYNINGVAQRHFSGAEVGFGNIYDMVFDSKKGLFITDFSQDKIHKIDFENNSFLSFSGSGSEQGKLHGPRGITTDKNDNIYVCDSGNNRIVKFDNEGNFLANIPANPKLENHFGSITSATCDKDLLYICDMKHHCLWVYTIDGIYQDKIEHADWVEPITTKIIENKKYLIVTDQISGVYRMNLENREIKRIFEPDGIVKAPIDAEIDHNGELIMLDSISRKANLYLPEALKHSNIILEIEQTFFSEFPNVTHKVRVRTKTGVHIRGLTGENFEVYEDTLPVDDVVVQPFKTKNDQLAISIVKDTNPYMVDHLDRIEKFGRSFFEQLSGNDKIQIIDGQNSDLLKDFTSLKLSSLYTLMDYDAAKKEKDTKNELEGDIPATSYNMRRGIGQALYTAIGDVLVKEQYKPAVILISSGDMPDINFSPIGIDECIHFAKVNQVPIYIVSFSDGPANQAFQRIVDETGGRFYLERTDGELAHLSTQMRNKLEDLYLVSYTSRPGNKRIQPFREVDIRVQCNEMLGVDKTEYIIP